MRITRLINNFIKDLKKKRREMYFIKNLKKEVDIGATGTHSYRIKEGPNKGKVL
jgi:molybdopterin-guanine dinucleotide biosynthesis protein